MALYKHRFNSSSQDYFDNIYYFFESFKDYIEKIDSLITDEVAQTRTLLVQYEKDLELNPTWSDATLYYHYQLRQKSLLVNIYYDSLILTIYSFIEKQMLIVCQRFEKEQILKIKDMAGKGIFKYRLYLEKVIKIDFKDIEEEWSTLLRFNTLRNFLVHAEGFRLFPKSNSALKNCLSSFKSIQLVEYDNEFGFSFIDNNILKEFCILGEAIINHTYFIKE